MTETYGRLTVTGIAGRLRGHLMVHCECACGTKVDKRLTHLKSGAIASCGCLASEMTSARNRVHGESTRGAPTAEFTTWMNIKGRCLNPKNKAYPYYGGRGIKICDRWLSSYDNFLADIGRRPSAAHSIERRDVNGDYTPENCKWATKLEQARNTRANTLTPEIAERIRALSQEGVSRIEISRRLGVNYSSVKQVALGKQWA